MNHDLKALSKRFQSAFKALRPLRPFAPSPHPLSHLIHLILSLRLLYPPPYPPSTDLIRPLRRLAFALVPSPRPLFIIHYSIVVIYSSLVLRILFHFPYLFSLFFLYIYITPNPVWWFDEANPATYGYR